MRTPEDMALMDSDDASVCEALHEVGIAARSVYDLVNTSQSYPEAVPILIQFLSKPIHEKVKEGVARALTVKEAKGVAIEPLAHEFERTPNELASLKWALGNAFTVVADDACFDRLSALARDRAQGPGRQMIVHTIARIKHPLKIAVLLELVGDPDVGVSCNAVRALGIRRIEAALETLQAHLAHPHPSMRRQVEKAIERINRPPKRRSRKRE